MRLQDRNVFITGAGSGIGRAAALLAAKQGASVACAEIVEDALAETVALVEKQGLSGSGIGWIGGDFTG